MGLRPIQLAVQLFTGPGDLDRSRRAITWLMHGLVQVNCEWLLTHPSAPSLYESGVVYRAERNTEEWLDIPTLYDRGFGDCEDLACARCGELQAREDVAAMPYITWRTLPDGRTIYHALVRWPDGTIEDPSRALGMRHPIVRRPVIIGVDRDGL